MRQTLTLETRGLIDKREKILQNTLDPLKSMDSFYKKNTYSAHTWREYR